MKFKQTLAIIAFVIFSFQCSKSDSGLPNLSNSANDKSLGASAHDLLSASSYNSLLIEVQYMPGMQLQSASLNNLSAFFSTYLNKPGGVQIIQKEIASAGKTTMSLNDIAMVEKQNRTAYNSTGTIAVYILVTDSDYDTQNVLGVAYRNTSVVLLGKTIQANSGGLGQASRTKAETTVLQHEIGHLLGLVDIGSAMQTNHKDASHSGHCNNTNCLMYYQTESADFLGFLITGNAPVLDANCHNDLIANGGK